MSKEKEAVVDEKYAYISMTLHTNLRKCCDSPPTTLLYNIIDLMPSVVWAKYGDIVADGLKAGKKPVDAAKEAGKVMCKSWYYSKPWKEANKRISDDTAREYCIWTITLTYSLKMFTDNDWRNFTTYLEDL